MPFRERVRRVLKRGSISNDSNSSDDRSSGNNPNVYQPGEKMPPMKYRRPVAKEHKEKLESFNFATAWRRMSHQSLYSPMGSRFPSRKNSLASRRASMASRKSIDRNQVARRSFQAAAKAQPVAEAASDEGDVGNVGLSQGTRDDSRRKRSRSPTSRHPRPRSRDRAADMSASGRLFAPEDLSLALKRTHLAVPAS